MNRSRINCFNFHMSCFYWFSNQSSSTFSSFSLPIKPLSPQPFSLVLYAIFIFFDAKRNRSKGNMVSEETQSSPGSDVTSMTFEETELTLGLPGEGRSSSSAAAPAVIFSAKRGFVETVVINSGAGKHPPAKAQAVGWPPVRSSRKKSINESFKYVKVGMDGAPYLRKVNLQCYSNYQELFNDLEGLFNCFIIGTNGDENKLMDVVKRMEYVPTYEDKDSDWMLVGDVPWKMFIESCKRIRLMKCSDAAVLALASKGSSSTPKC